MFQSFQALEMLSKACSKCEIKKENDLWDVCFAKSQAEKFARKRCIDDKYMPFTISSRRARAYPDNPKEHIMCGADEANAENAAIYRTYFHRLSQIAKARGVEKATASLQLRGGRGQTIRHLHFTLLGAKRSRMA